MVPVPNPTKDLILKLMVEKEAMESKISEYGNILANNANVGMDGALIDVEGFPRNDIDVYQVRQARQQIICLQNDYKALMKEIEKQIHKLHSEAMKGQTQVLSNSTATLRLEDDNDVPNTSTSSPSMVPPAKVIVKVNMISPGSPAEEAGLRVDDEILEFGTINCRNFQNDLSQISDLVGHMQNKMVPLKILRMGQHLDIILIPKSWSGRGLLGCKILLADS